ncbi:MAG: hypothetical protein ACJAT2_000415 [Bacteriovoracaceae bacterium]|jgi:hypothetical protein
MGSAHGALFSSPPTHIKGQASLEAISVDDLQTEARVVSFSMFADIKQTVLPNLEASVIAGGVLETGSNESLFVDEFKPRQDLVLKEASLSYAPIEAIKIEAGALNQNRYESPLLLTDTAFVSAKESLQFKISDYSFGLFLSQSVPSNHFLTNRLGSVDEGAPSLLIEGISMHLAGDLMFFKTQIMRFKFNNLSSNVAYNSQFLGNSTRGSSTSTTAFLYDFEGYNAVMELGFNIGETSSLTLKGQYLYNDKAPDGRNTGYLASLKLEVGQMSLTGIYFKNESDSSPAFYNSSTYGHNDRDGQGLEVAWMIPTEATSLYFKAFKLNTNQQILQSDSSRFYAGLTRSFSFD